jgi:hypothetical protein
MLRFAAHFVTRTNRAIKDLFDSTVDLNAQRFCLPYLNAQMVKFFPIHDAIHNVAQMANYVALMSQLLAIQDNQHTIPECMPNLNGVGTDTPEQNSHDAGSELFQAASSGNVSMTQALLSVTDSQSYINYTDGLQPKRTRTDDDAGDAHDLLAEFDNCDLSDHRLKPSQREKMQMRKQR